MIETGKLLNDVVKWGTLAVLAAFVGAAASGQLIGWLGGVPKSELREAVERVAGTAPPADDSVQDLLGKLARAGGSAPVPTGLVVASLEECLALPGEWREYEAARGRMVLGANPNGTHGYAERAFGSEGGFEEVALDEAHLPPHSHEVTWRGVHSISLNNSRGNVGNDNQYRLEWKSEAGNAGDNMVTNRVGGNQPHPNMPPYIALYFCEKL